MNKILKSFLIIGLGLGIFTACDDDRDSNPTLISPTEFVLNTPAISGTVINLANSSSIEISCSQPDYGFPANVGYYVQVAFDESMTDFTEIGNVNAGTKISIDAPLLASTLTDMKVNKGATDVDFPMDIAVYIRLRAVMMTSDNKAIEGTEILSNVVSLNKVHLLFSLPPVNTPENLYIVGGFNEWNWDSATKMIPVNGATHVFWSMVWIDDAGIKFNQSKAWDGNETGFSGINSINGDLAGNIKDNGDNIATDTPGWYLMVITSSVSGRNLVYDIQFNKPEIWLMGPVVGNSDWKEQAEGWLCTIPDTFNASFVSPAFAASVPGGDGDGVRAYVKIPTFEWWKSEFMVFDGKIEYRANDGDQARVAGKAGQQLYLNFATGEGEIK